MKRIVRSLIGGLLMLIVLVGCGGKQVNGDTSPSAEPGKKTEEKNDKAAKEKVTITFWHSMGGVNGKATEHLVEKFNKENDKNIEVVAQYQGSYDDAINKLKSAQIGKMGADLVQVYDIGTRFMIDSGWIVPMQNLIDRDHYDISQIEPNIAAYYTVDNKLYSMPFNSSTPLLYYNKDIFKKAGIAEPPKNFREISEIAERLTAQGGAKEPISLDIYGWFFEQFLAKQGLEYCDHNNGRAGKAEKVVFDQNGGGKAILEAWKKLYDEGKAPIVGKGGDAGLPDFTAGKAAMTIASTASLKQVFNDVNGRFEIGTAYLPGVTEENKGVSIGGASLWALDNKDPKKQEAVWTFVKFLISPEAQAYWNAETGYFPITVAAHEEPVFKENIARYPQFETAIRQLHDASKQSQGALLSVFPEARKIIENEIENMLNNNIAPEDSLRTIAEKINKAIEEYNSVNP